MATKRSFSFDKGKFDVVSMDVQMPELDDFETTAAIRAKEQLSGAHIPIAAMTAHAQKGDKCVCLGPIQSDQGLLTAGSFSLTDSTTPNCVTAMA